LIGWSSVIVASLCIGARTMPHYVRRRNRSSRIAGGQNFERGFCPTKVVSMESPATYNRGDRVEVEGYDGKRAVLIVWEVRPRGLLLCVEEGFQHLLSGREAPTVGFPFSDV